MTKKTKKKIKILLITILILANLGLTGLHFQNYQQEKKIYNQISTLQTDLTNLKSQENIKKLLIAKQIKKNDWYNIINKLFNAYSTVNNMQNPTFVIQNMNIDLDQLKFVGYSNNWKNIYLSGGILTQISNLEFIKQLEIPSYQTKDNLVYFTLTAKLNTNGK